MRATRIAAIVGRVLAVALGLLGLYAGNLILILIAAFIFFGAAGEARQTEMDDLVRRYLVRQVMDRHPPMIDPAGPLSEIAERARIQGVSVFFVVGPDGALLGRVSTAAAFKPPLPIEPSTRAIDLMAPAGPTVAPSDSLAHAIVEMQADPAALLPVVENGRLVGVVGLRQLDDLRRGNWLERVAPSPPPREREA